MLNHRAFKSVLALALLAALLFAIPAAAEMRIFTLQHRPADEIAETVWALLGEQAKVAVHRNTLIVRATEAEIAEVETLVAAFDQPLTMLRITIEQGARKNSAGKEISASGSAGKGSVRVDIPGRPKHEDSTVFMSTGEAEIQLHGQSRSRSETRHASQVIAVLDGATASINVGRAVPFTSQLRYYARRHPHYVETISYQRVDTGFVVTPYLHGDVVEAEVSPFMAYLDRDKPSQIVFHEVTSRIRIPVGAWYDLSQHMQTHDDLSRVILSAGSESNDDYASVRIRIDPQ